MGWWSGLWGRFARSLGFRPGRAGYLRATVGAASGVIGGLGARFVSVQGHAIDLLPPREQNSECYPSTGWRYPAQGRTIAVAPIVFRHLLRASVAIRKEAEVQPYRDIDGDSNVTAYEIGPGSIIVQFAGGATYLYNASAPGSGQVAEMQRLARSGDGLNAYINKYVRKNFAAKLT